MRRTIPVDFTQITRTTEHGREAASLHMGDAYTVEKVAGEWLISVSGVGFFRCGKRQEAVRIARLATELLKRAVKDSDSRSSGIFAPDTPARGGKHR